MAKTKGLGSASSKSKSNNGSKASKSLGKKVAASKISKSNKPPPKKSIHNDRRSSLRNPFGRVESAPLPDSSSALPLEVSSEYESAPSNPTVSAQNPSTQAHAEPEPSSPPCPTSTPTVARESVNPPLSPSGNFLVGRSSLFASCYSRRPIHVERLIDFFHFPTDFLFIRTNFESCGWVSMGSIHGSASVDLVREFFTNFHCISTDQGCFDTLMRGHKLHITVDDLADFLKISRILDPTYPNVDWASIHPLSNIALPMRDNPNRWFPGIIFRQSDLSVPFRILNLICDSLLTPITRSSEVTEEKLKLLYCLSQGVIIDLPSLVFQSMASAHKSKNSRLCLPYGILITNILRDKFQIVNKLVETSISPDPPISRATIRRTIAQKLSVSSFPPGFSPPPALFSSGTQPTSSSIGSASLGDPLSVVILTITFFTERLTRLEQVIHDSQTATNSRIQKLEDTVKTQIETIQMNLLEPLQAAANSVSKVAAHMEVLESSVRGLVNPAQTVLTTVSNEVTKLVSDIGDLNRSFAEIAKFGRQRSQH